MSIQTCMLHSLKTDDSTCAQSSTIRVMGTSESTASLHVKQSTPIEHPQTLTKFHVGSLIGYFVQFGANLTSR